MRMLRFQLGVRYSQLRMRYSQDGMRRSELEMERLELKKGKRIEKKHIGAISKEQRGKGG